MARGSGRGIKGSAKAVQGPRYVCFQAVEVSVARRLWVAILMRIRRMLEPVAVSRTRVEKGSITTIRRMSFWIHREQACPWNAIFGVRPTIATLKAAGKIERK